MKIPAPFRRQSTHLFEQMDRAYDAAARKSGFVCNGCRNNCCLTRFYHHTLVEYLYIKSGLEQIGPQALADVKTRAMAVLEQTAKMEQEQKQTGVMCPLNRAGRCMLYAHRPMICRLHGISHALRRPDGRLQTGPGCDDFYAQCGPSKKHYLDRTPLYVAMAKLERQLRMALGFDQKIKMTIAQIVIDNSLNIEKP
ncbi:MAG: YkgJ family cysteine cluster protein [Desulfobacteraceae bacterium]|jgi:Fe-S-cluster containining protein